MFDTLDLRGQILRLRREHKDRKKEILLDRIRWNKEQQRLAGLIRMTEKTAGANCLSPIVDERLVEQRKNKLANILKNEKIKTDPSKCVNSGQSNSGSDYIPCRVLDDESEMQDFSRKIRGKAIGILQRSQIIENEQRRKKKEMDEKEQELCWLEELKAKNREMEINKYVTELAKKKALHDDIAKQIASQEQIKLGDFEAEKRHCGEITAKELDEINQENEEACKRKEELNRDQQEFLKRHERELQDRKLRERDFEAKKQEEWENMNASIDANRNLQLQNVMAQRKRQEIAAKNLEELRRLEGESLSNQAAKASTELELGRSMLESLKEFDETVTGSLRTLQEQAKYRCELDHFRNLKKVADENRKTFDMEMDRLYMEACEKEEAKRRENAEMKRSTGLEIGKYLRDQIEAHDGEKRKVRNTEMESDRIFIEDQNRKDKCIENAKQQMLSEFQAWKTSLASTPGLEKLTNKATHQMHAPRPINCTHRWTTVSSDLMVA